MTVDLEAIARRMHCELTSLKSALPLLEQGYTPPFLARYRRDELGGLGESALWSVYRAMREEAWISNRRQDLMQRLEQLPQVDPAIPRAVRQANSKRVIDRLARRVRGESGENNSPAKRVAARILTPEQGDPGDVAALVRLMGLESDLPAIESTLDEALVNRLTVHPQIQNAAVKWLFNNAKIRILSVSDSHLDQNANNAANESNDSALDTEPLTGPLTPSSASAPTAVQEPPAVTQLSVTNEPEALTNEPEAVTSEPEAVPNEPEAVPNEPEAVTNEPEAVTNEPEAVTNEPEAVASPAEAEEAVEPDQEQQTEEAEAESPDESEAVATWPTPEELAATIVDPASSDAGDAPSASTDASTTAGDQASKPKPKRKPRGKGKSQPKAKTKELKTIKKISPRQRRRRWLVTVLQPLAGKEILAQKLTAFQTLMIGRGLRSGVVQCQFVYDVDKLAGHLQRTAESLNESFAPKMRRLVDVNDAVIREASEAAWWDELLESSATRLVSVAADHLDSQINRQGIDAKIVLSIDAMGPRTAAVAIVAADGRLLHTEDIPCQLTAALRSAAVTRAGELIHQFGVDLIVVSNGPARRGCLVILHELVDQSPPDSIRWTLAERSGADVYAGSELGNREMRSTPRRFRSAAWLAFSVLRPSQAVTKVDPMRLRLGSFQRELSEDALWPALSDVMTSGVSRGGVDVNSAPVDWLCQLPGLNRETATELDKRRRESLFTSRNDVSSMEHWTDPVAARQAIAFLRVFGSTETLDGTLIHPDDYALAKKLATALKLELPPATPPGYQRPKFDEPAPAPSTEPSAPRSNAEEIVVDYVATENFAAAIQPAEQQEASVAEDAVAEGDDSVTPAAAAEPVDSAPLTAQQDVAPEPDVPGHAPVRQPIPEAALINKCIKEWQVGARRVQTVVEALCNPFGEEDMTAGGAAHAVMTRVPKLLDLKVGDQVIGVVVGVTEFGAFVEMSPECSGLIHVSRVADRFVEDLHEAVQVGDVITAWITNVDAKRRRVGLSAISPERELELDRLRQERRDEYTNHRGSHHGSRAPRGGKGDNRSSAPRSDARGDSRRPDANRSAQPAGQSRAASSTGGSAPRSDSRDTHGRGDSRPAGGHGSGRGGAGRGDSRQGGQRGGRRDRDDRDDGPSSYSTRVPRSNTPATPISEAMAKGDEPLRSFGDLMQFFKKVQPEPVIKPKVVDSDPAVEPSNSDAADSQTDQPAVSSDAPEDAAPPTSVAVDAGAMPES